MRPGDQDELQLVVDDKKVARDPSGRWMEGYILLDGPITVTWTDEVLTTFNCGYCPEEHPVGVAVSDDGRRFSYRPNVVDMWGGGTWDELIDTPPGYERVKHSRWEIRRVRP